MSPIRVTKKGLSASPDEALGNLPAAGTDAGTNNTDGSAKTDYSGVYGVIGSDHP